MAKRFYRYEHRTTSLREFFIRTVLRRPLAMRRACFSLEGISLDIRRGESVAFIGRNGSGKSTALRLIAGIYAPSAGELRVTGRIASVIELGAGFNPELTGRENVELYGAVMGLKRREVAVHFDAIVDFADLGDFVDEPVKYYSSGMQARLAFAVTVAVEPDILLLDEVLAVGDAVFRERCLARLERFRARGGTLVVVSHDLQQVRRLCDRAVWLEKGRVRQEGPAAMVTLAYEAEAQEG
ncbi:MAG TPA: ABC transporter ATP-binding protein [Candidatus Polarisedimenticolaceae bacterium]|nr:ABC transporter ATP-binding protein [Candidatus Polarisedimenticolaceae bacterium]